MPFYGTDYPTTEDEIKSRLEPVRTKLEMLSEEHIGVSRIAGVFSLLHQKNSSMSRRDLMNAFGCSVSSSIAGRCLDKLVRNKLLIMDGEQGTRQIPAPRLQSHFSPRLCSAKSYSLTKKGEALGRYVKEFLSNLPEDDFY